MTKDAPGVILIARDQAMKPMCLRLSLIGHDSGRRIRT
jgi:hypothetical protein